MSRKSVKKGKTKKNNRNNKDEKKWYNPIINQIKELLFLIISEIVKFLGFIINQFFTGLRFIFGHIIKAFAVFLVFCVFSLFFDYLEQSNINLLIDGTMEILLKQDIIVNVEGWDWIIIKYMLIIFSTIYTAIYLFKDILFKSNNGNNSKGIGIKISGV